MRRHVRHSSLKEAYYEIEEINRNGQVSEIIYDYSNIIQNTATDDAV
jgi:hypothetical protein